MIEYKLKNGNILKDGHTMFLDDVVKDLDRRAYLESILAELEAKGNEVIKVSLLPGHKELVECSKVENGRLYLGGYSIDCDRDGNEISRTEPTYNGYIYLGESEDE